MANCKDIKKDIHQMTSYVLKECYIHLSYSPKLDQENTLDIISDAMLLEKELIKRVNHYPKNTSKKEIKAYFSQIIKELLEKSIEFVDRLN